MKLRNNQHGVILITILLLFTFIITVATIITQSAFVSYRRANEDKHDLSAQLAADAGIDNAIYEINQNDSWAGISETLLIDESDTHTTIETSVTTVGNEKIIESTGRSYHSNSLSTLKSERTIEVKLRAVTHSASYSLISGVGGLRMQNNSKIVAGSVFVNGEIELENNAQIGLSTNPVVVQAAHQSCPTGGTGETYPTVCGAGENDEPIAVGANAHIYGAVYANNQVTGDNMSNDGLHAGEDFDGDANDVIEPLPLPDHDREALKAAISTTMTNSAASCDHSDIVTWPANLHITGGDVTIKQNCQVTVEGDVWIDGKLTLENSAILQVAESLGETRPVIMIDDKHSDFQNGSEMRSNSFNTGFEVIAYYSNAACSPDCSDVTGADLRNSTDELTIHIKNNFSAPDSVFYSRWSQVKVDNSGDLGALVGQSIELKNSATITFGTTIDDGGEPVTTWVFKSYKRNFN